MADKIVMMIEDGVLHMKLFNDVLENQGYKSLPAADGASVRRNTFRKLTAIR